MNKDYFYKNRVVLADGAMGTYYAGISGRNAKNCEFANLSDPDLIKSIHEEYLKAGARLIRTNSFGANTAALNTEFRHVREILCRSFAIATETARPYDADVMADIGPIPRAEGCDATTEYIRIADIFLECGAENFIFETFGTFEYIPTLADHIKKQRPDAFILAQFAVTPDGFSLKGASGRSLIQSALECADIDACGFNCASGPRHLYNQVREMGLPGKPFAVMPNAGYPAVNEDGTRYINNVEYFARCMGDIASLGVTIIGGCCGTTPQHILETGRAINNRLPSESVRIAVHTPAQRHTSPNTFQDKLNAGEMVLAVEFDPPRKANAEKIISDVKMIQNAGADIITLADCPLARARADSTVLAAKIKRETGIETMPHIACRDRNINAIKALLLGAHIEGIRNVLVVTGDPIPDAERSEVKAVYNHNSFMLAEYITELNRFEFEEEPLAVGAALNINADNLETELRRAERKASKGITFFLTQPAYCEKAEEALKTARSRLKAKILAGLLPVVCHKNAVFLRNEVPGIYIPDEIIQRFENKEADCAEAEGKAILLETARRIRPHVDGYYLITPFGRAKLMAGIVAELRRMESC